MKSSRFYLLILLIVFGILISRAQQGNQKSEILQEINDLKNDIKELEAEIADAKINYPEDVPELQKDLAATKKMLASFEKMAGVSTQPKLSIAKAAPAATKANNSPIVPIALSKPVTAPLPGKDTDRLLWYKGKKINDSTLITTNAMLVQHQKKKDRVVAQPDKNSDQFQKLVEELEKSEQRKDQLIDKFVAMKNGPLFYEEIEQVIKTYDDYTIRYNEVVKNTVDIPNLMAKGSYGNSSGSLDHVGNYDELIGMNLKIPGDFLEIIERIKKMMAELPSVDDFPPPPEHDLEMCSSCDVDILEKERKKDKEWIEIYLGKETEITWLYLGLNRQLALLGIDGDTFERDNKISIDDILLPLFGRIEKKNEILIKKYGKDVDRKVIIAQVVLGHERQMALLGGKSNMNAIEEVAKLFAEEDFVAYFNKQASARNYNFVLNVSFFIGLERQKQLLGDDSEAQGRYGLGKLLDMSVDFNRFALTLDLDFIYKQIDPEREGDKTEMKATGNIYTKDKVYVFLFRDKCTWKIGLGEIDFKNANEKNTSLPLTVRGGYKSIRNEEDELVTYQYSGNKELLAQFPSFSIDLCNDFKKDSAFMMPLSYATDIMLSKSNKSYKEEILPIANHMFVNVPKAENILDELSNMASDIFNWLSGSTISKPTGNPKMDDLQEKFNQKKFQDKAKADISKKAMNKESVLLFDAQNGQTILVDMERDTKHEIDENTELEKGIIHLKIIHDPVSSN